jgi:hypothetical protein
MSEKTELTPEEKILVDAAIAALKALPDSICVMIEESGDQNDGDAVRFFKRRPDYRCDQVASLDKPSLIY